MAKAQILGVEVDVIDKKGLHDAISECIVNRQKHVLAYVNVHAINIAQQNLQFRNFLNDASIVYCDGEGVRLGARILGNKLPPRIVFTYWIWDVCRFCEDGGFSIFFLGGTEDSVSQAVARVKLRFPLLKIVGWHHGYFEKNGMENETVVNMVNRTKPNLLIVGFGMPLQEQWINDNIDRLEANVILPSGSMIEYTAGRKGVAPHWMADHGMEWLYRLFQEPRRLWKRYLLGNPQFMIRILAQRLKQSTGTLGSRSVDRTVHE